MESGNHPAPETKTMTTKTLEVLKEEAAIAAKALEEAQIAAVRQDREAKVLVAQAAREAAGAKFFKRKLEVLTGVASVAQAILVNDQAKKAEDRRFPDLDASRVVVKDGLYYGDDEFNVEVKEEYSGSMSMFHSTRTGKLRVSAGEYGNRQSYPQRQNGGFNYDAIAEKVLREKQASLVKRRGWATTTTNQTKVEKLVEKLTTDHGRALLGSNVTFAPTQDQVKQVKVDLHVSHLMTIDQAEQFYALVKTWGLK